MKALEIPVILWGKPCVVSKGPDGVAVVYCNDGLLKEAVKHWNEVTCATYSEFEDARISSVEDVMPATKRGQIVNIYADEEALNEEFEWFTLDLRSDVLQKRGPLGKMSAVASPFVLEWNSKHEVKFKFDDSNQLYAVVDSVAMSLSEFVKEIPNSDYYIQRVHDLLE